jgi:uncharacterized DUF497 family protein
MKMPLLFEWDEGKALLNQKKHGISFEEAATAFGDRYSITVKDADHSDSEERLIHIGVTENEQLVIVSHIERGDAIRIISAMLTTKRETRAYEEEK